MDRRKSLKLIVTGAIAAPVAIASCNTDDKGKQTAIDPKFNLDRNKEELEREKKLIEMGRFFTDHELATVTVLADIIIPKDEISGSASEAKVPEFIDFIMRDMPDHQVPIRGGLHWLDVQCLKRFEKTFVECNPQQQIEMIDLIAYPDRVKDKPELKPGVVFFNRMRNLTAAGFFTSQIGVKDLGYAGNVVTQWNGIPDEVLKQYGLAYSEKELKECVKF